MATCGRDGRLLVHSFTQEADMELLFEDQLFRRNYIIYLQIVTKHNYF